MSKQEVIICRSLQEDLERALDAHAYDKLFILTDEHTRRLCLPLVGSSERIRQAVPICIGAGDIHKNLDTLAHVWTALSNQGATRHSLLINLGGGMVTDLGDLPQLHSKEDSHTSISRRRFFPWLMQP